MSADAAVFRMVRRETGGRGRTAVMLALGALVVVLAALATLASNLSARGELGVINASGLTLLVPVGSLLVATGALGEMRDSGTLSYLWLRPVGRGRMAVVAYAAVLVRALPLTVVPIVLASLIVGGLQLAAAGLLAAVFGTAAYTAVFLFLGLLTKRAVLVGLVYVALWEGVVAALGTGPARVAIRTYARSVLDGAAGVRPRDAEVPTVTGVIVLLVVTAVAVALTTRRLQRLDVP